MTAEENFITDQPINKSISYCSHIVKLCDKDKGKR